MTGLNDNKIKVSFIELMTLNEIQLKHRKMRLDTADQFITILKQVSKLTSDTSIEEMEETQSQLRAFMNSVEDELKNINDDKKFVEKIIEREK